MVARASDSVRTQCTARTGAVVREPVKMSTSLNFVLAIVVVASALAVFTTARSLLLGKWPHAVLFLVWPLRSTPARADG